MKMVPDQPEEPRNLVWLVDSLDRLTSFPEGVRQKLGFALYQAQIGQKHESAKMLHGFRRPFGRCARTIPAGHIVPCMWRSSRTLSMCFMSSRRKPSRESPLRNERWT